MALFGFLNRVRKPEGQEEGGLFGFLDDAIDRVEKARRYAGYTRDALPGAAKKTATGVRDIAVSAARDTTRVPAQLTVELGQQLTGDQSRSVDPSQNRLTQALLGSEPLSGIGSEAERQFGSSSGLAQAGVLAFGALDIIPGGGTVAKKLGKEGLERLMKETTQEGVKKILKGSVSDDVIEQTALAISKTKDPNTIAKILDKADITKAVPTPTPEKDAPTRLKEMVDTAFTRQPEVRAAQSQERAIRAARVNEALQTGGVDGYHSALKALKGPLTDFSMKPKVVQQDAEELMQMIHGSSRLLTYEKVAADEALMKLIDGKIPPPSRLRLLEEVFGPEPIEAIRKNRGNWAKARDVFTEAMNLPRALISSFDASAPLRQGIVFSVSHPSKAMRAGKEMFTQAFSSKNANAWLDDLYKTPEYRTMKEAGLYIADPRLKTLSGKEERFMSNYADKIPWVAASNRAYTGYLNKLRVDVFNQLSQKFKKDGLADEDTMKSLGRFVNNATGRGNMGGLEKVAQELNSVFFSPRLMASRFNMLNPTWYAKQAPPVRKEAIKNMAEFVGAGATILGLLSLNDDVDVSVDPRSADFGKVRVGDTRWDMWGGFQQWARVFAQLLTEERTSPEGITQKQDRLSTAGSFLRNKLTPSLSTALDVAQGRKPFGEEMTLAGEVGENVLPIYLQDMLAAHEELGPEGMIALGAPAFFGVGTQHYASTNPQDVYVQKLREVSPEHAEATTSFVNAINDTKKARQRASDRINTAIEEDDVERARSIAEEYNQALVASMTPWLKQNGQYITEDLEALFQRSLINLTNSNIKQRANNMEPSL